jgi:3D (Asp-Asp-Asp) domain-containing protein
MDQDEMSNLYRGPSIDASYQVSVHLAEGFGEVGKGNRVDVYLEVRKRRGHIFFE